MADLNTAPRDCPLCGGTSHETVSTRSRRGEVLRTVLCAGCGHVFTNPAPSAEDMAAYYRTAYRQDYKHVTAPKRKHIYRAGLGALRRLAQLSPHIHEGARVIDVGAGGGEFVYLLASRGHDARGIEPHEGYAAYARDTYEIDVAGGPLETTEFPPGAADAVTLHHVLEHTVEPMLALQRVRSWLKEGGVLAVEVPNLASWAHAPHHRFHRAHLHTFSLTGLQDALENAGFRVLQINRPGDRNHLNAIAVKVDVPDTPRWRNAASENRAVLAAHTPTAHVLSGQPLRRINANFTRPLREAAAIRALGSPSSGRAMLDALYSPARKP